MKCFNGRALPRRLKSGFAAACLAACGVPVGASSLALSPEMITVAQSSTFTVNLLGTDLADVYAFQFTLDFAPTIVHLIGLTEGPALGTAGTTFFAPGSIDNGAGHLDLSGNTLIGAISGFTGGGVLATLEFSALSVGSTSLTLGDALTLDSGFNAETPALMAATVHVSGPSPVPEPSIATMFALGLVAVGFARAKDTKRV
jgi:hypothetical protein